MMAPRARRAIESTPGERAERANDTTSSRGLSYHQNCRKRLSRHAPLNCRTLSGLSDDDARLTHNRRKRVDDLDFARGRNFFISIT